MTRPTLAAIALLLLAAVPTQASTASRLRTAQHDIRVLRHQVSALADALSVMRYQNQKRDVQISAATEFASCHQLSAPIASYGNDRYGYLYGSVTTGAVGQTGALDWVTDMTGLTAGVV